MVYSKNSNRQNVVDQQTSVAIQKLVEQETPLDFSRQSLRSALKAQLPPFVDAPTGAQTQKSKTEIYQGSFIKYAKEIFNKDYYTKELSQDGTILIQFLELSKEMNVKLDIFYVCMRLFYNKIKECELIDDNVIVYILENMPPLIDNYFDDKPRVFDLTFIKKHIESMILSQLTDHITEFIGKPDIFVSELSNKMAKFFKDQQGHLDKVEKRKDLQERLRNMYVRFFEVAIGKTIWNIKHPEGIWKSFIGIANGLQILAQYNIISHMDDLDDLFWSLTRRFCFFLDLVGASLPVSFYQEVEADLANGVVFFLEYQEQDQGIRTKKDALLTALASSKVKSIAFEQQGILSTPLNASRAPGVQKSGEIKTFPAQTSVSFIKTTSASLKKRA